MNVGESDVATIITSTLVVAPGEVIAGDSGYLRGHGTYVSGANLVSNTAGLVERVDRLVSVRPVHSRYIGEVGDIVVGRVLEIGPKRWLVDVSSRQDAVLPLSSVQLSGGEQRRRSLEDQLAMRSVFAEGDLVSAEVHSLQHEGNLSLHARSVKYGKLENGCVVCVPPSLVVRLKQHSLTLPGCGVDAIIGLNGWIWLTVTPPTAAVAAMSGTDGGKNGDSESKMRGKEEEDSNDGEEGGEKESSFSSSSATSAAAAAAAAAAASSSPIVPSSSSSSSNSSAASTAKSASMSLSMRAAEAEAAEAGVAEAIERLKHEAANRPIDALGRDRIARVRNAISMLRDAYRVIAPDVISAIVRESLALGLASKELLEPVKAKSLLAKIKLMGGEPERQRSEGVTSSVVSSSSAFSSNSLLQTDAGAS